MRLTWAPDVDEVLTTFYKEVRVETCCIDEVMALHLMLYAASRCASNQRGSYVCLYCTRCMCTWYVCRVVCGVPRGPM